MFEIRQHRGRMGAAALGSILLLATPGTSEASPTLPELIHRQWKTTDGLPHNTVTALAQDSTGYLWIGTVEGLVRFDGEVFTVFDTSTTPELRTNFVNTLLATRDGGLWIGTRRGLNRYEGGVFSLYTLADGLAGDVIEDLADDGNGTLWIGTRGGLSSFSDGMFHSFEAVDGLAGPTVFSLAFDSRGDLWVGAKEGLFRYSDGSFRQFGQDRGLRDNFVVSLEAGPGQDLWAGTLDGGLHHIDTESFQVVPALPRTPPRLVFSLHHDESGVLWIGTRTGLERSVETSGQQIPEIGDDLVMSLLEDRDRRLWVGTLQNGLHVLEAQGSPRSGEPPIVMESLVFQQQSFLPDQELTLPKGRADIEFRYTAIDFDDSQHPRFRYFLEGYDDFWVDAGRQRHAVYTNLPPGKYRFRVRSARGRSDVAEAAYSFEVPARFYQTRIFKLLALVAMASSLWGLFLWRIRRLLRTRILLQERIAEQTQETLKQSDQLEDFHQRLDRAHHQLRQTNRELKSRNREKADFLAIATHDLRAPLVNLKGFAAELRYSLDQIQGALTPALRTLSREQAERGRKALEEDGPEALSFIEGSAQRMEDVIGPILKMSRLVRQPLRIQPVSLKECLDLALSKLAKDLEASQAVLEIGELPSLLADARALQEIFYQLIANALSSLAGDRPGKIEVQSRRGHHRIQISVRDNGRPLEGRRASRPFQLFGRPVDGAPANPEMGLGFVRILVQRHGGKVWHESNLSIGNTFYFSIPREPSPVSP